MALIGDHADADLCRIGGHLALPGWVHLLGGRLGRRRGLGGGHQVGGRVGGGWASVLPLADPGLLWCGLVVTTVTTIVATATTAATAAPAMASVRRRRA